MRIICPTCASHYEVDAARIAAQGQLVRCARCRDVWLVRSPGEQVAGCAAPSAAVAPTAQDSPEVIDFQAAKGRLRSSFKWSPGRTRATSLTVLALAVAAAAGALSLNPIRIAARLPMAADVYAAVGLTAPRHELALRDIRSVLVADGDDTVLTLQGSIANIGDQPADVPDLSVVVRSDAKLPLYTWTAAAPKPKLASGESVAFHSRLASPPPAGRDVRVSFADAGTRGE